MVDDGPMERGARVWDISSGASIANFKLNNKNSPSFGGLGFDMSREGDDEKECHAQASIAVE